MIAQEVETQAMRRTKNGAILNRFRPRRSQETEHAGRVCVIVCDAILDSAGHGLAVADAAE